MAVHVSAALNGISTVLHSTLTSTLFVYLPMYGHVGKYHDSLLINIILGIFG